VPVIGMDTTPSPCPCPPELAAVLAILCIPPVFHFCRHPPFSGEIGRHGTSRKGVVLPAKTAFLVTIRQGPSPFWPSWGTRGRQFKSGHADQSFSPAHVHFLLTPPAGPSGPSEGPKSAPCALSVPEAFPPPPESRLLPVPVAPLASARISGCGSAHRSRDWHRRCLSRPVFLVHHLTGRSRCVLLAQRDDVDVRPAPIGSPEGIRAHQYNGARSRSVNRIACKDCRWLVVAVLLASMLWLQSCGGQSDQSGHESSGGDSDVGGQRGSHRRSSGRSWRRGG